MKHIRPCENCGESKLCKPYWYFLCDECAKKVDLQIHHWIRRQFPDLPLRGIRPLMAAMKNAKNS